MRGSMTDPYVPPAAVDPSPRSWTVAEPASWVAPAEAAGPPPLYWRVLRLHHVRPNGWQRALLVEGVIATAVTLALADVASAWALVALPAATAVMVKANDVLAGLLPRRQVHAPLPAPRLGDYAPLGIAVGFFVVLRLVVRDGGPGTYAAVLYTVNALLCFAIYRYLVRRNTAPERAITIAVVGFVLSVFAAALGAAIEVRRRPD
jgi:hypothetical protein